MHRRNTHFIINIALILSLVLSSFAMAAAVPGSQTYAASGKKARYIAHRGWSAKAPENSLAALKLAAQNPHFYGVEFDIWESTKEPKTKTVTETAVAEDGTEQTVTKTVENEPLLLVMHDENINRTCGVSKNIHKITRKNLSKYTITKGKNVSKYRGQKIPTLEQALDTIYTNSKGAIPVIELKERLSSRALKYMLQCLDGRKAVVISFSFKAVADTEKMARSMGISGNIQTMYLRQKLSSKKYSSTIRKMKAAGIDCISLNYKVVSKKTVKKFHKAKLQVCTWTLPNKKTARRYRKMGADYITANGKVY